MYFFKTCSLDRLSSPRPGTCGGWGIMLVEGMSVKDEIHEELIAEQITTSQDASIPGVLVDDSETARAQADAIKEHTLGTWGPYSQLPREDPRRAQFIDGVALRSALNMAVIGFGVTDLVIGVGVIVLVGGLATLLLATPGIYFLAGMVTSDADREYSRATQPKAV